MGSNKLTLKDFKKRKGLMMFYIKPKLVALYLIVEGFVHNCVLKNMYWFNNTAGMNLLKINNESSLPVLRSYSLC
jgi:hypothetical protein